MLRHIVFFLLTAAAAGCAVAGGRTSAAAADEVSVARFLSGRQAALSMTFDDGLLDQYTIAFPMLRSHGIRATFGIIGSKVGRDQKGTPCMTWEQLRDMAADGQEITSHGYTHRSLPRLHGEELRVELELCDSLIARHTGTRPVTFLYPFNQKNDTVVELASRGRVGTRTFQVSLGSKRDSAWMRGYLDALLREGRHGVTMTHGIERGYDAFRSREQLRCFVTMAAARADSLWIAPLRDVLAYAAERDAARIRVRRKGRRRLVISVRVALDRRLFSMPLTLEVSGGRDVVGATQAGRPLRVYRDGRGRSLIDVSPHGGKIDCLLSDE